MASPVEFLTRRKRDVDRIVDQTYFRLLEETGGVLRMFPRTGYVSRKLLGLRFEGHRPTIASVIAPEQEIPASRPRMALSEDLFTNCKVGKQIVWKEPDFEMMEELRMVSGQAGSTAAQAIERHYFGTVADLVPSIYDRSLMIAMQVGTTGTCTFTDERSRVVFSLTYSDTESTLFPTALTTTARWSQASTTVPLDNLESLAEAYYDVNGMYAPYVVMRLKNFREVRSAASTKIALLRNMGADATTPDTTGMYVSDQAATDLILQRTRARELVIFDAQYSLENEDGTVTDLPYLPDEYIMLGSDNMLEQAFVPTVERNFQQGIYQASKVVNDAPRVERTVAVANMIPACFDRRKLCARKVN